MPKQIYIQSNKISTVSFEHQKIMSTDQTHDETQPIYFSGCKPPRGTLRTPQDIRGLDKLESYNVVTKKNYALTKYLICMLTYH